MLTQLQATLGYTRTPVNPGDDGTAFISFLAFVTGYSQEAKQMRAEFDTLHADPAKTETQNTAAFIDWLITHHWGEAAE